MGNKERPTEADSYIDALNITCAWLAMEIRCAMYNLKRDAAPPDEVCRRVGCEALISFAPRPGKKHLVEAVVRDSEPVCDPRKQHRRIRSTAKPALPKTPGEAEKKPKNIPKDIPRVVKVVKEAPQQPPKKVPETLPEETPQVTPRQDTSTTTPGTSGPWINPFPQKRWLVISTPEPAEPSPSPDTNQGQTISNDQLWPDAQPPPEVE